jgi:hypothetical protein
VKSLLLISILVVALLPSCTHVGVARPGQGAKGGMMIAGVTSFFGEVISKDVHIKTAEGDEINIGALATHNPDREVTGAVRDVAMTKAVVPLLKEAVSGENAVRLKGTADPNVIPKNPNIIPVDPQFVPPTE